MKMKEVTARTGLTDKAVRLYIENELITPQTGESYTGRRSFDFSEENVQQLKNIATLRKAGFSLADIKTLQLGDDTSRETLRVFLKDTRESVTYRTQILHRLEPLLKSDNLSVETICRQLETEVRTVPVPIPDLRYRTPISKEARIFRTYAAVALLHLLGVLAIAIIMLLIKEIAYRFFSYTYWMFLAILLIFAGISSLFGCVIFLLYPRYPKKKKEKKKISQQNSKKTLRRIAALISAVVLLVGCILSFIVCGYGAVLFIFIWESRTDLPMHYLSLDADPVINDLYTDIYYLFPPRIPDDGRYENMLFEFLPVYPKTTKYHYALALAMNGSLDICAEWHLSPENVDSELERLNTEPDRIVGRKTKGDWNCIYFKPTSLPHYEYFDEENHIDHHAFLIFAYNQKTETVRYIVSYAEYGTSPYHLSLDWS